MVGGSRCTAMVGLRTMERGTSVVEGKGGAGAGKAAHPTYYNYEKRCNTH